MPGARLRVLAVLGAAAFVFTNASLAGAHPVSGAEREADLAERLEGQDSALRDRIEEITAVGDGLERAQAHVDGARARVGELRRQASQLENKIAEQELVYGEARQAYEERARAAYKGESLDGVAALLDGWFGSGDSVAVAWDPGLASVLLQSRQDLAEYEESEQDLRNSRRQISQMRSDYENAIREQRATARDLRRREQALDRLIGHLDASRAQTEDRLRELKAAERARVLQSRPATGVGETNKEYELGLAHDRTVASAAETISEEEYMDLYRASSREYGFGSDWYILAAVGAVESNHGENMGPSSAGAMGPMQFLPSTWETSGVDGNGDGVASIMDPEDAIPAAAAYLKVGGAPQAWYRALYSYNHADWYVKNVLAVAEGYRRLARDENVGPYV